jgi:hypothetical protein
MSGNDNVEQLYCFSHTVVRVILISSCNPDHKKKLNADSKILDKILISQGSLFFFQEIMKKQNSFMYRD